MERSFLSFSYYSGNPDPNYEEKSRSLRRRGANKIPSCPKKEKEKEKEKGGVSDSDSETETEMSTLVEPNERYFDDDDGGDDGRRAKFRRRHGKMGGGAPGMADDNGRRRSKSDGRKSTKGGKGGEGGRGTFSEKLKRGGGATTCAHCTKRGERNFHEIYVRHP